MIYKLKVNYKFVLGLIFVMVMLVAFNKTVAKRYDKANFPISYIKDEFPSSYMQYINELKKLHPNWIFKAVYTGLDWNEVITHESYETSDSISLVPDSYGPEWKKDGKNYYMDGYFVTASKEAVKYMIDPRNHLTEDEIFQFETLNYSQSAHTKEAIEKVLYGTSMYQRSEYKNAGNMVTMDKTYSQIILENAVKYNVSATHIASRIRQETACDIINNGSINGSVSGYEGLYNFFNIGASANSNGSGAVINGLQYARQKSWTTPEASIDGGVEALRNKWIKWGQNTTYFQKWDVNNEGAAVALYAYQYMQNIIAPTSESIMTKKAYQKADLLNATYEFRIPVYENMPDAASPYPSTTEEAIFVDDYTKVRVDSPTGLNLRNGPGTEYGKITILADKTEMIRIAKSTNTQWDRVRLANGVEGYVFRDGIIELESYTKPEKISLNVESLNLHVGQTQVLSATIFPENASVKETLWSSDNIDVVTVEDGKIIAKGVGSANVTVKLKDFQISASCKINVSAVDAKSIELEKSKYTVIKGKKLDINPIIKPEYAQDKEYIVTSSNEKIVKVDGKSLVGVDVGETEITFKLTNKDLQVTAKVRVVDVDDSDYISFDNTLKLNEEKSYITKIEPGTSVKDFMTKIKYNSEKFFVSVKDISGKEISEDELIGTGTTISLKANDSKEELQLFTIIIYGDVNGDGNIYATDYVKIKNHIMEVESLSGACIEAADADHDGNIYATDYVKIKNYIMQSGEISQ